MNLLIVESPAKAKTIGKYLGKDFKVLSSYGHVRGLPSEEGAVKPDAGFSMLYKQNEKAAKQMKEIEVAAKKSNAVYLATDPDREGEAIAWHIMEILRETKALGKETQVWRVVFHEITKKAVQEAIKKPAHLNQALIEAQRTRQAMDWLVGFTLSPVLWNKIPGGRGSKGTALSAGRVQSVALRLVCEREQEIEKFIKEEYWTISAQCKHANGNFQAALTHLNNKKLEKFSLNNEVAATAAVKAITGLHYSISNIEKKVVRRRPSAPFTTSTMLQEAGRKLGFSAKRTAQIAQKLYEGLSIDGENVGLITYMRTDSVTISSDARNSITAFIAKNYGNNFLSPAPREYKTKTKNAQEAHEAIRPTNIEYTPEYVRQYLDHDQFRLYELIWKRTVSSQMSDAEFEATAINISDHDKKQHLRATGLVPVFDGFLKVYREDNDDEPVENDEENSRLPAMKVGDKVDVDKITPKQHFTQPPPRYTDASLVKNMEELGIGRPSTYPTIIGILQDRGYVAMERKTFVPQLRGMLVNTFLTSFFKHYVEYSFTADLENELDDIANGERQMLEVLKGFWYPFKSKTDQVMEHPRQEVVETLESQLLASIFHSEQSRKCPKCEDGQLGMKFGKFGIFIGCSNYPTCNYTKDISNSANAVEASDEPEGNNSAPGMAPQYPIALGNDPGSGNEVSLRKGPYGVYVQLEQTPPKRSSLPAAIDPQKVNLEYALGLLSLPRVIGAHPENAKPVRAGIGRFGPYVENDGNYRSIRKHDPLTIELDEALEILAKPKAAGRSGFAARKKSSAATTSTAKKSGASKTTKKAATKSSANKLSSKSTTKKAKKG
ncbi:MAG: type I DNA topoisomerase [Proteobacteria bacterium]|nr:type I DNA topoisomerase [Pseudomonadota bacterium]